MAINDSFTKATAGLADASDMIIDGSGAETGAVNVTELAGSGAVEVYKEVDTAGDGSWAASVLIDTQSGNWHSQGNDMLCSQTQATRLRVRNTSGGAIDVQATGYEVND